jgi:hypothetical protein
LGWAEPTSVSSPTVGKNRLEALLPRPRCTLALHSADSADLSRSVFSTRPKIAGNYLGHVASQGRTQTENVRPMRNRKVKDASPGKRPDECLRPVYRLAPCECRQRRVTQRTAKTQHGMPIAASLLSASNREILGESVCGCRFCSAETSRCVQSVCNRVGKSRSRVGLRVSFCRWDRRSPLRR